MIPDLVFARTAFNRFNAEVFDGKLPLPTFAITRAHTFRGKLVYRWKRTLTGRKAYDFEIRLSSLFNLPDAEWEDVVIHEMIHLHIAANSLKDSSSHGPLFRSLMEGINRRHGRNIEVSSKTKDPAQNADTRVRAHFVLIARFRDGRYGVTSVTPAFSHLLEEIPRLFPELAAFSRMATTDPWFNTIPRSRTPKIYRVDAAMLREHLRGARLLEPVAGGFRVSEKLVKELP